MITGSRTSRRMTAWSTWEQLKMTCQTEDNLSNPMKESNLMDL